MIHENSLCEKDLVKPIPFLSVHEVKKPQESYNCHTCFKSFTKGIQLQEHMKVHTIESDQTNSFVQISETLNHENSLCKTKNCEL